MAGTHEANQDQAALWNDASGRAWAELQTVMDGILAPFEAMVVDQGFPGSGGRVMDVGCGAGATTLAMARRLGGAGRAIGVDISEPLIAAAKARTAAEGIVNATFIQADAQTHTFEPGSFDAVISRFGVMFFDDPEGAFANLWRATRTSGKLTFVAWRSPAENPFMTTARSAAEPLLPDLPTPDPNAPGQFAFADGERVRRILDRSGWSDIDIRPVDVEGRVGERDLLTYVTRLGPVGMALKEVDEATRARVTAVVRAAFEPYIHSGVARFKMACWSVGAVRRR